MVGTEIVKLDDIKNKFDKNFVPNNTLVKDIKRKSTFHAITHQKNVVMTSAYKAKILEKRI